MGTDPTPPTTPSDPSTPEPAPVEPGTEPAPVTPPSSDPDAPVTEDPALAGAEPNADDELDDEPEGEPAEGLGEPLDRKTTLADDTAPGGHLTTDPETGVSRQHGDVNPELGQAPDELAGTAHQRGDQASEGYSEPEQVETDRPDVGTPVSDEPPAPLDEPDED